MINIVTMHRHNGSAAIAIDAFDQTGQIADLRPGVKGQAVTALPSQGTSAQANIEAGAANGIGKRKTIDVIRAIGRVSFARCRQRRHGNHKSEQQQVVYRLLRT